MGASVTAYWPGISEEQMESQPGFHNDCKAWGDWMAERENEPAVFEAVGKLNAGAILTVTTAGMKQEDVQWVTPSDLREAATCLREAVEAGRPEAAIIVQTYERNANCIDPVSEEFVRDLSDIEALATWAEAEGAHRITLEVNW